MLRAGSLALACLFFCSLSLIGQSAPGSVASSDDISVAEGLQLPTFGHMWALDTWKGVDELLQFTPADATTSEFAMSWRTRHALELKRESATIRLHALAPQFFLRGVSEAGSSTGEPMFAMVRLHIAGQRRVASKEAVAEVNGRGAGSPDVIQVLLQRVGSTDWYRLSPAMALTPGEYVIVPLPHAPAAFEGDIYDFAIDPEAPENASPRRSEENRQSE